MNINRINISYSLEFDLELDMINGLGTIEIDRNEESGEMTSIGSITFNYYNVDEIGSEEVLLHYADSVSNDEIYMVSTLMQSGFDFEWGGKLITLDQISIDKNYYSEELEQLVLKEFIRYCQYMMFDYLVVIASKPIQERIDSQEIVEFPQLKLYTELNFNLIGGSEIQSPVMLKNLNFN